MLALSARFARLTLPPSKLGGPLVGPSASMALWKSHTVKQWIAKQPDEGGVTSGGIKWNFWSPNRTETGKWIAPRYSRATQAMRVKRALKAGELMLEPTVMVPPPHFKGKGRHRRAEARRAEIAEKLAMMPQMIREHKE
ncbi:MAG: hypothetical protein SGPRY_005645, partial [Prymnesium sp.]